MQLSTGKLEEIFDVYKRNVKRMKTHTGKLIIISKFLQDTFHVDLVELALGAEKFLKSKVYEVRGRADLIFGRLIVEIKIDLRKELEDAEEELARYLTALKDLRKGERFTAIATDGIRFYAYRLVKEQKLKELSNLSIEEGVEKVLIWLDSYFFSFKGLKPTAEDLKVKFGLQSPTYSSTCEIFSNLFDEVCDRPHVDLKLSLWKKYLEIVYGSAPEIEEFISHTYLVTLAKIIMYLRVSGRPDWHEIEAVLEGSYFIDIGITNFIEEDFYTWILTPEIKEQILKSVETLARELMVYDFSLADEDLFKEIYQEIVGREARHRIGEYYTPEWLAELTLREAFNFSRNNSLPRILDPACGSGTFLTNAIHILKYKLKEKAPNEILDSILNHIVGVDINPLAVVIARANYMIALGDILKAKTKPISLPIYVADSIRPPFVTRTVQENVKVYTIATGTNRKNVYLSLPEEVVANGPLLDAILNKIRELSILYGSGKLNRKEVTSGFRHSVKGVISLESMSVLQQTISSLTKLIDEDFDTVWIFVLRNIYAPIRLQKEKFDIVAGNPPWIALRYVENKNYQGFLKENTFKYKLLSPKEVHLFTQLDTSTLFYMRCADLYLKEGGIISFVMPRSVLTGAKHHRKFKEFRKPKSKLLKILDMEKRTGFKVRPLFNVPSCVLLSVKGKKTTFPVPAIAYDAKLVKRNAKLKETLSILKIKTYDYSPPKIEEKKSVYFDFFKAGAAIYPRPLWFIDFDPDPLLGLNPIKPRIKSSDEALKDAKGNWKKVLIKGNVESRFIFVSLLSKDLIPFGYKKLRPIVLPIKADKDHYETLEASTLRQEGYTELTEWIEIVQVEWKKYASKKDKENFPTATDAVNYLNLLTLQDPSKRYIVLSASSGTHTAACVVDTKNLPKFNINGTVIEPKGFVADKKTYFFRTNSKAEAFYLTSIINSGYLDEAIKPYQSKGLFGERDIGRLPFVFPVPVFDPNDKTHLELVKLGKECSKAVVNIKIGSRRKVKEALSEFVIEIDKNVEGLLS